MIKINLVNRFDAEVIEIYVELIDAAGILYLAGKEFVSGNSDLRGSFGLRKTQFVISMLAAALEDEQCFADAKQLWNQKQANRPDHNLKDCNVFLSIELLNFVVAALDDDK